MWPTRGRDVGCALLVVIPHRNTAGWVMRTCAYFVCRTDPARHHPCMQHRAPAAQSIRGAKGLIAVAISFTNTIFSRSPWPARRLKLINA